MIIYIVCKYGECLSPEIHEGLAKVECNSMTISSESKYTGHGLDRENISNNWKTALDYFEDEIFIGMDSDIVLEKDSIDILMNALQGVSFAFYPIDIQNTHGLWSVRKEVIDKVPFKITKSCCPICSWRERLVKTGYKNKRVDGTLKTVERITIAKESK